MATHLPIPVFNKPGIHCTYPPYLKWNQIRSSDTYYLILYVSAPPTHPAAAGYKLPILRVVAVSLEITTTDMVNPYNVRSFITTGGSSE